MEYPTIEELTQDKFKKFGTVIERLHHSDRGISRNRGTALEYPHISPFLNNYDKSTSGPGQLIMSLYECFPRKLSATNPYELLLSINVLERHPFTTQTFVPMGIEGHVESEEKYLVAVAPTLASGEPDVQHLKVFMAQGNQAVTYGVGVWHSPMIAIGNQGIDFVMTRYINGVDNDDYEERKIEEVIVDVCGNGLYNKNWYNGGGSEQQT